VEWQCFHTDLRLVVRGGAAYVPVLIWREGSDHKKIGSRCDATMPGSARQYGYVSRKDLYGGSTIAAENQRRGPGGESQDLVRGGVVMVKTVDSVAPLGGQPLWRKAFRNARRVIAVRRDDGPIKQDGQVVVVRHPSVLREPQCFRIA